MALEQLQAWLTIGLGPSISAIVVATVVALFLPIFLHHYFYRARTSTGDIPKFLLAGPSGSGKTSLLTLLERQTQQPSLTHTSQTPFTVEVSLPETVTTASSKYRSVNDPSKSTHQRFLVTDTPGHGKLRHFAINYLKSPQTLRGVIFVVDATDLSPTSAGDTARGLTESAEFLHDILLTLQKRNTQLKSSKRTEEFPVLIAVNKLDLFSALPVRLVKSALETEITNLRSTRTKGLQNAGSNLGEDQDEERDWLGDYGGSRFDFGQMNEFYVPIEIAGGNVYGADGNDISKWWQWIGSRL